MKIIKTYDNDILTVNLEGRLETTTAPELDADIKGEIQNISELIFDFEKLEYMSSAGLRVLLFLQKELDKDKKKMVIRNVNSNIIGVFQLTGFTEFLNIE